MGVAVALASAAVPLTISDVASLFILSVNVPLMALGVTVVDTRLAAVLPPLAVRLADFVAKTLMPPWLTVGVRKSRSALFKPVVRVFRPSTAVVLRVFVDTFVCTAVVDTFFAATRSSTSLLTSMPNTVVPILVLPFAPTFTEPNPVLIVLLIF